jgi:hypothetical protein
MAPPEGTLNFISSTAKEGSVPAASLLFTQRKPILTLGLLSALAGSVIENAVHLPCPPQLLGDFANRNTCLEIETYDDHRMAMAFAPVGLLCELIIHEPGVVAKSYPSFWDHIHKILKSA